MSGSSLRAAACLDITIKVPPPKKTKMSSASHCPSHPGCLRVKKKKILPFKIHIPPPLPGQCSGQRTCCILIWSRQKINMKTARHVDVRTEGIYDKECCQRTCQEKVINPLRRNIKWTFCGFIVLRLRFLWSYFHRMEKVWWDFPAW